MPKSKTESSDVVVKHKHCPTCGVSISLDEQFCGKNCEEEFKKVVKSRKIQLYGIFAMYSFIFIVMFLLRVL